MFSSLHLIREEVKAAAQKVGFSAAGITSIEHSMADENIRQVKEFIKEGRAGEMEYLKRSDDQGRLLRSMVTVPFPWAKSVILCMENYNSDQPKSIDPADPDRGWIARYAWSSRIDETGIRRPSDYHKVLLKRLKQMDADLKERLGDFESRCFVDTGPLVERNYARSAGLGWIGKNTCLLNQQQGSWLFLASIITSMELPAPPSNHDEQEFLPPDRCGSCRRCLDACPTEALIAPHVMDARLCIAYLTIEKKGDIPEKLREKMGRQIFGCDICQDVCPWNRKAPIGEERNLTARAELVNPSLEWLGSLDEEAFNILFNGSPVRRAGWNGLRRNIAIAMGNSGLRRFLPRLREWLLSEDSVLRETSSWAIQRLENVQKDDGF
jgi:epoxyqueuosine reductase